MQSPNYRPLIPIACRFVPRDQWFTTHLDDSWKVKQIKHWTLSKCNLIEAPDPPSQRPVSPITFAPTLQTKNSADSLDEGYHEDNEYGDDSEDDQWSHFSDLKRRTLYSRSDANPRRSTQSAQHGSAALAVDRYTLISFSTGTMLEDDFTLSWYKLQPYELLEMHQSEAIVPLPREVMAEYVQPYFLAKVKALRAVWNQKSRRFEVPVNTSQHQLNSGQGSGKHRKRRRSKLEWKDRWVVINQGILNLFKEQMGSAPVQQFSLATLKALRGAESLKRASSIIVEQHVVCVQFQTMQPKLGPVVASPPSTTPSSPRMEDCKTGTLSNIPTTGVRDSAGQEISQKISATRDHDPTDVCHGEGEWVVLDMLDDHAFSSILRILHRYAPHPISSSFLPSSSIITVANNYDSPEPSLENTPVAYSPQYDTIPYPEWRINAVENARRAGMGDVGRPMAWVLWAERGLSSPLTGSTEKQRRKISQDVRRLVSPDIYDRENDSDSDGDSEIEWEGWMRDLERQGRVREQYAHGSVFIRPAPNAYDTWNASTPLPSSPLSDVSSTGSIRGPSSSHVSATNFFVPSAPYPNISNVIENTAVAEDRFSVEMARLPEKMKTTVISTVSVGPATPPPRRRSSTLTSGVVSKLVKDKDKVDQAPATALRAFPGTISHRSRLSTSVRHPSSSMKSHPSSSPLTSDAAECYVQPGDTEASSPGGSSKRQSAFVRGVSLRAEKIVKRLDSAIDFVDGKHT
ncbi:hypothetical protein F5I97DRAFT_1929521 [Phlebopus sp. FC_14]|nr:hypothetical protein F5I97DRAFT_1929521 [Phlebopus sp. FC_14]